MRSCEYLNTPGEPGQRRTKKLKVRNFTFRRGGNIVTSNADLHKADSVSVTFENQKNGEKMEVVTQHRTGIKMCPVRAWGATVARIRGYQQSTDDTPIDAFQNRGKLFSISGEVMRIYLRNAVKAVGESKLGFPAERVGTHSIRSSFAMMLLLNDEADSVVMKKGRWKSNAFLRYIRAQVSAYGINASKRMVNTKSDHFYVIPHIGKFKIS